MTTAPIKRIGYLEHNNNDIGLFVVEVSLSTGRVLHPVSFGKILHSANVKDIVNGSMKKIGRNCVVLSFQDSVAVNTFFCNCLLAFKGLRAFMPSFNVTRLGLIRGAPLIGPHKRFLVAL
ncbi:hypothetical protein EVAR_76813_1 [Eumeta japonica]|uniref:Uncharacterized protein n=1 Tax=Eumeta variegata TaxID=151549 RepID=A0A4C1SWJ2_EUMVA|nr:hypothetical protein EVAR_76813_1 [Eumeta japonica]